MPCDQIREISVEFKVDNLELLKKAVEKLGYTHQLVGQTLLINNKWNVVAEVDLQGGEISSRNFTNARTLTEFSYKVKRTYSEMVIDEVAKKNRWIKRQLSEGKFQLAKY